MPLRIALCLVTSTDVTCPVTYMTLTLNSPLPGPVACGGASARHSKFPPWVLAWNATSVVTGSGVVPPVPPSMIVFPAPATPWSLLSLAAAPVNGLASARSRATHAITIENQNQDRGRLRPADWRLAVSWVACWCCISYSSTDRSLVECGFDPDRTPVIRRVLGQSHAAVLQVS